MLQARPTITHMRPLLGPLGTRAPARLFCHRGMALPLRSARLGKRKATQSPYDLPNSNSSSLRDIPGLVSLRPQQAPLSSEKFPDPSLDHKLILDRQHNLHVWWLDSWPLRFDHMGVDLTAELLMMGGISRGRGAELLMKSATAIKSVRPSTCSIKCSYALPKSDDGFLM